MVLSRARSRPLFSRPVQLTEKLDGLNVGLMVSPPRGLVFFSRVRGRVEPTRVGTDLWPLLEFALAHAPLLCRVRGAVFGEWLEGPTRLPYPARTTPFVALTLRQGLRFLAPGAARRALERAGFVVPPRLPITRIDSEADLERLSRRSALGGPAEGVVLEQGSLVAKYVRADFLSRPRRPLPAVTVHPSRPAPTTGSFVKRFPLARAGDVEREARVLRLLSTSGVVPRVRAVRERREALELVLSKLPGAAWPRRASVALAATLGEALGRLHRSAPLDQGPVDQPSTHAHVSVERCRALSLKTWARVLEHDLLPFVRREERRTTPVPVWCHGDLKPSNLRVSRGSVWVLDFDRARRGDAGWELACAMDRLALTASERQALLVGYGATPSLVVRAQLFRLVWQVALPLSVLQASPLPGPTAFSLARRGVLRALEALVRWSPSRRVDLTREAQRLHQRLRRASS